MFTKRVLIKSNKSFNRQLFEDQLRLIIDAEYEINYHDNITYLEIYNFDDGFLKINILKDVLNNDFGTLFTILIVPKFDEFMLILLNSIHGSGVFNAYQVLISLLIKNEIRKEDIPYDLTSINQELLKVFIIYYENGLNICVTARLLYLHRNTLNYKLTKLSEELDMDVRDNLIANFIYLLLKII